MTRNQIDALRLQEQKRHNLQQEAIDKWSIPANYLSGVGSIVKNFVPGSKMPKYISLKR